MIFDVVKVKERNGQVWLTCYQARRYVALIHVVDDAITSELASLPIGSKVQIGKEKVEPIKVDDSKEAKWREFDLTLGRKEHSVPLRQTRSKGESPKWNLPPYSHL